MQRRIFRVGGLPFVAARDGFFETHGTLAALIEKHRPAAPDRRADRETAVIPTQVAPTGAQASAAAPGEAVAAAAQRRDKGVPSAKPRKARTPRPKLPSAAAEVAAVTAEAPEAEGGAAGIGTAPTRAPRRRVAGRRAGEPPTPRWMTAGKERRGRLK